MVEEQNSLTDIEKSIIQWETNIEHLFKYIQKLKYKHVVSNFYYYKLKRIYGNWSWIIIIISTVTSGITVINNIDEEKLPLPQLKTIVNGSLTVCSMVTSLIAAWIKKKQFIEKINELDRYIIKINQLIEELEFEIVKDNSDKILYDTFKEKFYPQVQEMLISNLPMSPKEWKECIEDITENYPEIIEFDGSNEGKLWPWFSTKLTDGQDPNPRSETEFYRRFRPTKIGCVGKPSRRDDIYDNSYNNQNDIEKQQIASLNDKKKIINDNDKNNNNQNNDNNQNDNNQNNNNNNENNNDNYNQNNNQNNNDNDNQNSNNSNN